MSGKICVLVGKRSDENGQERWDGVTYVVPVDVPNTITTLDGHKFQANVTHFLIINEPTITRALPVAQGGIEANMGAKKTEMKNITPVTIAVIPVFPPSKASQYSEMERCQAQAYQRYRLPIQ